MTVGTNTYVTLEEADTYIGVRGTKDECDRWVSLESSEKQAFLLDACDEIEALPLIGQKLNVDQLLAFPRLQRYRLREETIPQKVKNAQIELALWLSDTDKQADFQQRTNLQAQGVDSFSIGDLSEHYVTGAGDKPAPLLCPKCRMLLKAYTEGGFVAC